MIDFLKFDDNISDEMLAAYIDGNSTDEESSLIENTLDKDSMFSETFDIVQDSVLFGSAFTGNISDESLEFLELHPSKVMEESDFDNIKASNDEMVNDMADFLNSEMYVYGEAGENISDPIFIQQPDDHSCALRSQQIVLRDFGIDIPFDRLEQIALDNGVYTNEGTYTCDIGKVLELAGVGMHQVTGTGLSDLMDELSQGHRVIVSVDANELWNNSTSFGKLRNWLSDTFGHQGGNHALIVAGIEVNPNNVNDIRVILTDPGAGHLRIEYPVDQFMDAWKDSDCFMAATDAPAPYQYDASTGMEIPSNFAVQQHVSQFIAENSYQLSPDQINIPIGYQPAFTGRINMDEIVSKDVYNSNFNEHICVATEPDAPISLSSDNTLVFDGLHPASTLIPDSSTVVNGDDGDDGNDDGEIDDEIVSMDDANLLA